MLLSICTNSNLLTPPSSSKLPLHPSKKNSDGLRRHANGEGPSNANRVDHRHHEARASCRKQAPRQVEAGARCRASVREDVHEIGHDQRLRADGRPSRDKRRCNGHRNMHLIWKVDGPAKCSNRHALKERKDGHQPETCLFDWKVRVAVLLSVFCLDLLVVHIQELPRHQRTNYRPCSVGDEGQSDVRIGEPVLGLEECGHGGDAHLPDGVVNGEEDCYRRGRLTEENPNGCCQVDLLARCRAERRFLDIPLHLRRSLVIHQRVLLQQVRRRPPTVSNNRSQRLWQQ
ncbi:hypothetical protein CCHR01_17783 [Colletotrichum chrysophilum]|uniref:Uncharacterized protein n=1 Tax=Colletotrichum chrysophilum TaxID=1836956 RepID=A0AAD9A1B4_9PEZI|nr:hypothetical protein CCHR01_17783 [Colletotrichum chrysophilum]